MTRKLLAIYWPTSCEFSSTQNTYLDKDKNQGIQLNFTSLNNYNISFKDHFATFYSESTNKTINVSITPSSNPSSFGVFNLTHVPEDYYVLQFNLNFNKKSRILQQNINTSSLPEYFILTYVNILLGPIQKSNRKSRQKVHPILI